MGEIMIDKMDDKLLLFVYHILHKKYGNKGNDAVNLDHLKEQEAQKKEKKVQEDNLKNQYIEELIQVYTGQTKAQSENKAIPLPSVGD